MSKMKVIIDCDTGIDDAQAIMMALSHPNVEVVAITCVNGNVDIDNVCKNTLRVLKVYERTEVPVFRGCIKSMVGKEVLKSRHVHGDDGMGDMLDPPIVDPDDVQKEHASLATIRLANQYPGEITLVALAPLTNIAVALRLEPDLGSKLKNVVIMGGNIEGKGNTSPAAEFNFRVDPEAAHVVLHECKCPITIVPWETCIGAGFSWDWVDNVWTAVDNERGRFLKGILSAIASYYKENMRRPWYSTCDSTAMAVAIDNSVIVQNQDVYATVELAGEYTKGQMICDWRRVFGKLNNATVVEKFDSEKVKTLLRNMLE